MPELLALPFLEVIAGFMIVALIVAGRPMAEAFSQWLDSVLGSIPIIGHRIAGSAMNLTRRLSYTLVQSNVGVLDLAARWLIGIALWAEVIIGNALAWPYWVLRVQNWLIYKEIPRLIKGIPHAATSVVHAITTRTVRVERTIVRLPKLSAAKAQALIAAAVATYVHPYLAQLRWLRAHFHALTHVIAHAPAIPRFPTIPNIWKRIRALERKVAPAAIAAAVIVALGRLGLGFIRCGNVKKAGKRICGLDTNLLDSLLLDTLAVFGVVSVVEFAHGLRTIEDEAVGILHHLIREFPAPSSTASG